MINVLAQKKINLHPSSAHVKISRTLSILTCATNAISTQSICAFTKYSETTVRGHIRIIKESVKELNLEHRFRFIHKKEQCLYRVVVPDMSYYGVLHMTVLCKHRNIVKLSFESLKLTPIAKLVDKREESIIVVDCIKHVIVHGDYYNVQVLNDLVWRHFSNDKHFNKSLVTRVIRLLFQGEKYFETYGTPKEYFITPTEEFILDDSAIIVDSITKYKQQQISSRIVDRYNELLKHSNHTIMVKKPSKDKLQLIITIDI